MKTAAKDPDDDLSKDDINSSSDNNEGKADHTLDLDLVKGKGPTLRDLSELSKKDKRTPAEQKILDDANEQFTKAIKPMLPNISKTIQEIAKIKLPVVKLPDFNNLMPPTMDHLTELKIPPTVPPPSSIEQSKQTYLLQQLVRAFEDQNKDQFAEFKDIITPRYDADKKCLIFSNRVIDVSKGKNYERFCRIMFKKGLPRSKPLQFGDLLDDLGYDPRDTKIVRNLVNNFNKFIAQHTMVDDLFYARDKHVYFDPKYV